MAHGTWNMAGGCQVAIFDKFDIPPPALGKAGKLP